jgi:hypothetical protein
MLVANEAFDADERIIAPLTAASKMPPSRRRQNASNPGNWTAVFPRCKT